MKLFYASLLLPAMAFGAWRPVPANLWAMQAVVPPGTNDTRALQPVVPIGGGTPVARLPEVSAPVTFPVGVPMPAGVPVQGGPPPAPGSPPRPVTPEGRFSPLPAGVIPAGQPSQTTPAAPASGPPSNSSPSTPVSVQKPQPCQLTLQLARTELPPAGGEFTGFYGSETGKLPCTYRSVCSLADDRRSF